MTIDNISKKATLESSTHDHARRRPPGRAGHVLATLGAVLALVASSAAPAAAAVTDKAKVLPSGQMVGPQSAPRQVKAAIAAANQIRTRPYRYGAGHQGWKISSAYDCSSAVSWALHGGGLLSGGPLNSVALMKWGQPGRGKWITVYTSPQHAYVVIAGIRFDTGWRDHPNQTGPRWSTRSRPNTGFTMRHPAGL